MNTVKKSQSKSMSGRIKTLSEYLSEIKEQVSFCYFEGTDDESIAEELCMIMAKVMRLPDNVPVSINQQKIDAVIVKETYAFIKYSHICHVMGKFANVNYPIKYKESYLRTALYRSTSEAEHQIENEVNGWLK